MWARCSQQKHWTLVGNNQIPWQDQQEKNNLTSSRPVNSLGLETTSIIFLNWHYYKKWMPNVLYLMLRPNYQNTIKLPCMQVLYSSECHRSPLVHHSQDLNTGIILIWQRMNEKAWRAFLSPMPIIVAEKCIKPRLKYSNHLSVTLYIQTPISITSKQKKSSTQRC